MMTEKRAGDSKFGPASTSVDRKVGSGRARA
jgi:hypothetical protein